MHILIVNLFPYYLHMVYLDGASLTIEDVIAVAQKAEMVQLSVTAIERMNASRKEVEDALGGTAPVYALNTGVGLLANIRLDDSEIEAMQVNLIRSHCCGVGSPLSVPVVRGMMLIRANVLAKGLSGIRPIVGERICDLLNHKITPIIPTGENGSCNECSRSSALARCRHHPLASTG